MTHKNQYLIRMYFVPKSLIKRALADMQTTWNGSYSWIGACDYLKEDDKFAVQVGMTSPYPYLENSWKRWEDEGEVK